jgi:hypothetical protein
MIGNINHRDDNESPIKELLLWDNKQSDLEFFYAPFEHVNTSARVVLIGITPGRTQMNRALAAASHAIKSNVSYLDAIVEVKKEGSFSGSMRPNIVNTLNKLGYQRKLGISCASELWGEKNHLVNFCSLLKYPVFVKRKDYNGKPSPLKIAELRSLLINGFVGDLQSIPSDAELVPLGDFVGGVLSTLDEMKLIPQHVKRLEGKVIAPPHPSGANSESISLLLANTYPELSEYVDRMYQVYLKEQSWIKKNGKPQPEEKYKAARRSRWESILFVRRAYGLHS